MTVGCGWRRCRAELPHPEPFELAVFAPVGFIFTCAAKRVVGCALPAGSGLWRRISAYDQRACGDGPPSVGPAGYWVSLSSALISRMASCVSTTAMIGATIAEMGMRVGLVPDTHSGPATARIMQIVQIVVTAMASSRAESATPGERRRRSIATATLREASTPQIHAKIAARGT